MMFNVVYALGELAYLYPISGGFYTYSVRFIDPAWGFAMGWLVVIYHNNAVTHVLIYAPTSC
jgi:yeast amino acid transporter